MLIVDGYFIQGLEIRIDKSERNVMGCDGIYLNLMTDITGPKISSRHIFMSSCSANQKNKPNQNLSFHLVQIRNTEASKWNLGQWR